MFTPPGAFPLFSLRRSRSEPDTTPPKPTAAERRPVSVAVFVREIAEVKRRLDDIEVALGRIEVGVAGNRQRLDTIEQTMPLPGPQNSLHACFTSPERPAPARPCLRRPTAAQTQPSMRGPAGPGSGRPIGQWPPPAAVTVDQIAEVPGQTPAR